MRVGFDAKRATMNFTGLGNYGRSLLYGLGKYFPKNEYVLFTPKLKNPKRYSQWLCQSPYSFRFPDTLLWKFFPWAWRWLGLNALMEKEKLDIYHGLSGELPWGRKNPNIPLLVTVHDLIFIRYPKYYSLVNRIIYTQKVKYACKKAYLILAISEQTKQDIVHFLNIPPKKITVLYQPCDDLFYTRFSIPELKEIQKKYNLPPQFILFVGTLEPRKRALELLKAYSLYKTETKVGFPLIFVGKKTSYFALLESFVLENNLGQEVLFFENIPLLHLPAFYQMANLFVYPSTFEGFGLPILEALVSGVPVITSLGSCFSEAGGEGSQYIQAENTVQFAATIKKILEDKILQQWMIKKGYEHSKQFTSSLITHQLMEIYRNLTY